MVDCATEGTVSVSTVMLRDECVADRVDRDEREGLGVMWLGRCVEAERCCFSCILPLFTALLPLSLPLPVCLLWEFLELRSSVTLDELTSLRSSSEVLCMAVGEADLW